MSLKFSALALLATIAMQAQTTKTLVVLPPPTPPAPATSTILGVANDSAPGFSFGSFRANATAAGQKSEMYFAPQDLFGRDVALGEIARMSYWTKTGSTHAIDPRDWSLIIYTKPYAGDLSTPTWYGDRIGAEPYFSANLADPANTWNEWSTDSGNNQLRFFESTQGAPGANFGTYSDPDWATFVAGNALSGQPHAEHQVLAFSLQTGSAWANGFTGQLDGMRVELTDGSVASLNFEDTLHVPTSADSCKKGGWQKLYRTDSSLFINQGDCVQYVNTGK